MRFLAYLSLVVILWPSSLVAEERNQSFDVDPNWEGYHNRPSSEPREIVQDFGYQGPANPSSLDLEIGGLVTPAGEAAWYAKKIRALTLAEPFAASGKIVVPQGGGNTLIGFFNPATAKEWRTANSLVWRINGRGETFHAHFEYTTQKWRSGAGIIGRYDQKTDRMHPVENPSGESVYDWSLEYDPRDEGQEGIIRAKLGEYTATCPVPSDHKSDQAIFTHFGLLNVIKSADGGGRLFISELTINGVREDISHDPQWEEHNNRIRYKTTNVRPWFDVGWNESNHAGGRKKGEIGGLFFRGDCREANRLGYYGDRISTLTLNKPIRARGRISFHRGVSDSTTLFGFFHHGNSVRVNESQSHATPDDFLGVALEGPSAEGFFIYPLCRGATGTDSNGFDRGCPRIYPDGSSHEWTLEYDPSANGGHGAISVSLDGRTKTLDLDGEFKSGGAEFDRFGFVSTWIDGNGQVVYLDDLNYTCRQ